jgi:endonuclease G
MGKPNAQRRKAADDTFYFTNCVPQHERLNAGLWRSLEQYILKTQTVQHDLKVTVITGPLLSDSDPYYIKKINGEFVKIPCVFWKVIYYPNKRGLNAVGFMMSHTRLLLQDGTVTFKEADVQAPLSPAAVTTDFFMNFKYDSVYQVKVEFIQEKTGLKFMLKNVHLPYQQNVKKSVLYKRIDVSPAVAFAPAGAKGPPLDYKLKRITL